MDWLLKEIDRLKEKELKSDITNRRNGWLIYCEALNDVRKIVLKEQKAVNKRIKAEHDQVKKRLKKQGVKNVYKRRRSKTTSKRSK